MIITFFIGIGTTLLGIGIEKMVSLYFGIHFIYAGLSIIALSFFCAGYKLFSKRSLSPETKKQIHIIFVMLHRNFEKWDGINSGTIKPKRKSDITEIYDEINHALQQYYNLIISAKIKSSHLSKYKTMKEFTKFPGAAIQPKLFKKAKKALADAFPKEENST